MSNTSSPEFRTQLCKNFTSSWVNRVLKPRKTVTYVEGCVIVAAAFLLTLSVLGPWRRRSRNLVVQYGVRGAYLLSIPLLSYTMGLMQGVINNELYSVWVVFLILLFGGTNSVSVHKLDENKQWLKLMFENFVYTFYLGTILGRTANVPVAHQHIRKAVLVVLASLLGGLLYRKTMERLYAQLLASDPRSSGSRVVDRNMKYYDPVLSPYYDPRSMQGYNYLVLPLIVNLAARPRQGDIQRARNELITLENIWCHGNGVLSMDVPEIRHLKDVCLSFALFRLAVRRYFGYACAESGLDKTRDLVLRGLLSRAEDEGCERAFQVIEVELAFLYDFFFTKYAFIMYHGVKRSITVSLVITTTVIAIGTYSLTHLNKDGTFLKFGAVETEMQEVIVTKVILFALAISELLQIWIYCASGWAKVSLVCKYIIKPSWQGNKYMEKLLLFMGKSSLFLEQHKWFRHWENKIGQYSLLDSFNYPSYRFLENQSELIPMFREGRKPGTFLPLPMEVKKALAQTLKDSNGHISNGVAALERHGMIDLKWACQTNDEFTLAHVIMVWHIATSYCEISQVDTMPARVQTSSLVATSLSKYCAYLVAFAPELVPGNPLETEYMLDELVYQARNVFWTRPDIYIRLREMQGGRTDPGMLAKGAILGMRLENMANQGTRWKLLADFWTELMLYIAPSDNVAGHIEHLAQGGEFVTHVWALLMHAGILERPAAGAA